MVTGGGSSSADNFNRQRQRVLKHARRNSNIELLRILAMFMVLMHHFIVHNAFDISQLKPSFGKFFFYFVMSGGGKAAVVIFFAISVWFLLDGDISFKSCLKRVWLLEREMLFWSILLLIFTFVFDRQDFGLKLLAKSFLPLSMGMWWYATSYSILLILMPFIVVGLKALGKPSHLCLSALIIIFYGFVGLIPGSRFVLGEPVNDGFVGFVFLLIVISFHKWYINYFSRKVAIAFMCIGLIAIFVNAALCLAMPSFGPFGFLYMADNWKLPVVMFSYGTFLIFKDIYFYSPIINKIARSSFAVYLITEYQSFRTILWTRLFPIDRLYAATFDLIKIILFLIVIYAICTVLDGIRQYLFSKTVDVDRGKWFEAFCLKLPKDVLSI